MTAEGGHAKNPRGRQPADDGDGDGDGGGDSIEQLIRRAWADEPNPPLRLPQARQDGVAHQMLRYVDSLAAGTRGIIRISPSLSLSLSL